MSNILDIYTDGSCIKKKDGRVFCGYGIYFADKDLKSISRPFSKGNLTNQRAEIYGVYKSLRKINQKIKRGEIDSKKVVIHIDSIYVVKSLNFWIKNWKKNNWKKSSKKPVENRDLLEKLDTVKSKLEDKGIKVIAEHVKAHTGKEDRNSKYNNIADSLAKKGALSVA